MSRESNVNAPSPSAKTNWTRVIKLGGSLLNLPNLDRRIADWILRQSDARNVWLIGGGHEVGQLRRQDEARPANQVDIHWACIDIMEQNAKSFSDRFVAWKCVDQIKAVRQMDENNFLFCPNAWLRNRNSQLPASWDVTSDSIAAALATDLMADELVLLKSTGGPLSRSIDDATASRFVDAYFACAAQAFVSQNSNATIRTVNFRSMEFSECKLEIETCS